MLSNRHRGEPTHTFLQYILKYILKHLKYILKHFVKGKHRSQNIVLIPICSSLFQDCWNCQSTE